MARPQTIVQLSEEMLATLDQEAAAQGRRRTDVIREAIERHLADTLQGQIDRQLVEAYERQPPDEVWDDAAAWAMIAAEPWEDAVARPAVDAPGDTVDRFPRRRPGFP